MRFVFMGTPKFAIPTMEKLHELGELALVITQKDARKGRGKKLHPSPVKERAIELDLEVYTPEDINSDEAYEKLREVQADFFVVAAYGQILKERILNLPNKYCINIHASLLPRFRGAAPIERAIMAGDTKSGVTIMKMAKGLDTGDMACKEEIFLKDLDAGALEKSLSIMGGNLLEEFIEDTKAGKESFVPQMEQDATYAEKITKDVLSLNFHKENSQELVNHILALSPHYGARIKYEDKILKIYRGRALADSTAKEPGTILKSKDQLIIKTLDGAIEILEIQAPGKRRMDIKDFLLGNQLQENSKLGD